MMTRAPSVDLSARDTRIRSSLSLTAIHSCTTGSGAQRTKYLFDASGGRGLEPLEWPKHLQDWTCGYAGGLGPGNLRRELPRIAAAAGPFPYWIDMESKLRDDEDRFWIGLARLAMMRCWLRERAHRSDKTKVPK